MAGTQRLLAIAMAFSVAGVPGSGKAEPIGVVLEAEHSMLGSAAASEGTTIYDGDRLSTDEEGALTLRIGQAIVRLRGQSRAALHGDAGRQVKEFEVELISGTALLSVASGTSGEIASSGARIRALSDTRGVVQVQRVGPYELIVLAQHGPAVISYRGESETIAEGKSYRVLLNPSDDNAAGAGGAKQPTKRNKALLIVTVGLASAAGAALLWRGLEGGSGKGIESPDRP